MAVDMFGNDLDPNGNLKPKKGQPGYVDPTVPTQRQNDPSQTVALSPAALSGSANYDTNAGNTAVLAQAQQNVLNQPGVSDLQKATTESATNWVKNPLGNYDPEAVKRASLDRANADWAKSFEAQRQSFGNVSGSGLLQQNMLANALSHNVDQATLAAQMDKQNSDMYQQALGASIGAGQSVNQGNENIFSQRLANAATVRGMAEGERAQDVGYQYELGKLDKLYGQDVAKMIASQNWQGAQNELDRKAAIAKQSGDIQAQKDILAMQSAFDMEKLNKTHDWQGAQNKIENELKLAMQSNDINATANNIQKQLELDRWKQDNGQKFTAEQNAMNRVLESSLATMRINAEASTAALERELTREVETSRITMQEKQLALNASQFADEASFKREALKSGVDQATADRIWKSSEAALDRTGAKELKQLDIKSAEDLTNLKAKIDSGMLVRQQDFESAQRSLDRALESAKQINDIQAQKDILNQKAELDRVAQDKQNQFLNSQRIATQTWQTGEAVRGEDAQKAAQYFDAEQKLLLQANDIDGQKALATMKNSFDLNMQTNSMNHDERMAYLDNEYRTAFANNDVTRQKDILAFQYNQEISKMAVEQGYEVAKMQVQAKIQEALNKGDYEHAEAMQKSLFDQQSKENAKDRLIQNSQVALQAKGINLQELEQQYSQLEKLVKAGTLDKSVLNDFVSNNMKGTGITLKEPDPLEAQKEADKEFAALQTEYLRTHPEMKDPVTGKLNAEGIKDFNNFVNKSMYGEVTTGAEATSQKAQAAIEDPSKYQELLKDPTVKDWTPQMSYDTGGMFGADKRKFVNAPTKGTIIKYGGKAYEVLSDTKMDTKGEDSDYFTVRDLKDGTTRRINIVGKATFGSKLSVTGF